MAKRDGPPPPPSKQLASSELVHPIYLDVPMMVSFFAAVEGGVSFEDESKTIEGSQTSREREAGGGLRLPSLMSMLSLDASGRLKNTGAESESSEVTTVRRHTEASLFNLLRVRLTGDDAVASIESETDLQQLDAGALVQVAGEVRGNPLQEVLDLFERVAPYMGIDLTKPAGKRSDSSRKQRGNQTSRQARQQQQGQDEDAAMGEEDLRLLMTMRADLDNAEVRDLVLAGPDGIKAVLTLSREFLHAASEEYLLDGRFRVLGKVTRVLAGDDYINLTRRTALGLMGPELVREAVSFMEDDPNIDFDMSDPVVEVPGVQLLPLAIFA